MTACSWRRSSSSAARASRRLEDLADLAADELVELVPGCRARRRRGRCDHHGCARAARLDRGARARERGRATTPSWKRRSSADAMMDLAVEDVMVEQEDAVRTRTRRCIATRAPRPAETLIRFVVGPDVDPGAGSGRRACPAAACGSDADRQVLARALARNQFAKAAKAPVSAPADLVDQVAGHARCAAASIWSAWRGAPASWWSASTRSRTGCGAGAAGSCSPPATVRPMVGAGSRRWPASVPVLDPFDRAELGGAVGREEVVHAGLAGRGLARQLLDELGRLHGFREFRMPVGHAVSNAVDEGTARP